MSKHTPGPWQFSFESDRFVSASSGIVCTRPSVSAGGAAGRNWKANARLIAAAPELLEALNTMLTHMGMDEDEWNKPTFDKARDAIAKAKGEQL